MRLEKAKVVSGCRSTSPLLVVLKPFVLELPNCLFHEGIALPERSGADATSKIYCASRVFFRSPNPGSQATMQTGGGPAA